MAAVLKQVHFDAGKFLESVAALLMAMVVPQENVAHSAITTNPTYQVPPHSNSPLIHTLPTRQCSTPLRHFGAA